VQLDDPRWIGLRGAYRTPYDPRPALARLAGADSAAAWDELWEELFHQNDVGEASYAALPELVRMHRSRGGGDWNTYAYAAAVEEARRSGRNPELPEWLQADYEAAWEELEAAALADFPTARTPELVQGLIAVLAHARGWLSLARLAMLTEDEREEILSERG
jgi:hypothetical protein